MEIEGIFEKCDIYTHGYLTKLFPSEPVVHVKNFIFAHF